MKNLLLSIVVPFLLFSSELSAQTNKIEQDLLIFQKCANAASGDLKAASCPYEQYQNPIDNNQSKIDRYCKISGSGTELFNKKEQLNVEWNRQMTHTKNAGEEEKRKAVERANDIKKKYDSFNWDNNINDLISSLEDCVKWRNEQLNVFKNIILLLRDEPNKTFSNALERNKELASGYAKTIMSYMESQQTAHIRERDIQTERLESVKKARDRSFNTSY